ncbi:hypothetical protein BCY88_33555 [Paraburkholderia fungorum]|uniref:Uncharacterized protein n=1 Tax=Paraburkholderia fungorum TaxID=134537 RepID=A0A3R7HEV5_9BURK|nr:hypothetical protein BCY88_33555 [Paraburkholderia fungorum]
MDIKKGDGTHDGEILGEKIDHVLEQLPIFKNAESITRAIAGQKKPDGTPEVPQITDLVQGGRETLPTGEAPGAPATGAPSTAKPGEPATASTTKPAEQPPASTAKPGEQHASASSSNFDAVPQQYAGKPSGNLEADPNSPGVFRDEKGQAYIQAADKDWPVNYDKDNGTWRVYNPADASKPQQPVQLDQQGNWQTHDNVGLKGGNPGDTAAGGSNANNRERLNTETQNSPTGNQPGSYTNSVNAVNGLLQRLGINLSDQSAETIINNVHHVDAGELSHAGASAREAWTFARDVADPHLPMKDRYAAAFGMVLNGIVSPAYHAEFDLENYHFGKNQTQDLRQAMQRFIQNDPHS